MSTKTSTIPDNDAKALRYVGLLGHTHVVLTDDTRYAADGRSAIVETCDEKSALRYAREATGNPRVYRQVTRGKWRHVPVSP